MLYIGGAVSVDVAERIGLVHEVERRRRVVSRSAEEVTAEIASYDIEVVQRGQGGHKVGECAG